MNIINVIANKNDLALNNVDNTSDLNKPISNATQTALNGKEDKTNKSTDTSLGTSDTLYPSQNAVKTYIDTAVSGFSSLQLGETNTTAYMGDRGKIAYDHSQITGNPHGTTKGDIGLSNVANLDTSTTLNITDSTNKRFVNDSQKTTLQNTSGVNTGDETNATIKTKLGIANATNDGYLSQTDYNTFNNKQNALGFTAENVANKENLTLDNSSDKYPTNNLVKNTLNNYLPSNLKGVANGLAELDGTGKVPSSQLPSFVDDVEEYVDYAGFPVTGESGKIYIALDTNLTYRWGGTTYVEISPSLALGETSSSAYRGDRGKIAYDHSQLLSGNPHNVNKTDIGLSNVPNTDATNPANIVETASYRFVTDTEKSTWNNKANASGNVNKISKFNSSNNLTDSQIEDNGSQIAIGSAIDINSKLKLVSDGNETYANYNYKVVDFPGVPYPVYGTYGKCFNYDSVAVGGKFEAEGGSVRYSVQLIDGTEANGRILVSDANGYANWKSIDNSITLTTTGTSGAATLVGNTLNIPQYSSGASNSVCFSPMPISVCDTAPTAATTQYYYQTVSEVTGTISKAKIWGYSGSDTVLVGIYRGKLQGTMTLIGQGSATCTLGANVINLTAQSGQNLTLTAGEDLVVGYYPTGISFRTIYDVGVSDVYFGIANTTNITTMPVSPSGIASAIRFALTLYS